jgi:hypothetical protein
LVHPSIVVDDHLHAHPLQEEHGLCIPGLDLLTHAAAAWATR